MNTELFIRRPVMTSLLMLAILAFGILGYCGFRESRSGFRREGDQHSC